MTSTSTDVFLELGGRYRLIGGARILQRPDGAIQIGTEPPHWRILHLPPAEAGAVLHRMDGSATVAEVLTEFDGDPTVWNRLLTELLQLGLLVPATELTFAGGEADTRFDGERSALVHRHGTVAARRHWQRRQEAVVVVRGTGRLAGTVSHLLLASGVGLVHLLGTEDGAKHPAPRPSTRDAAAMPLAATARPGPAAVVKAQSGRQRATPLTSPPRPGRAPDLVVLADDGPPHPWELGRLLTDRIPHLAVAARLTAAVIGPLVLPGRTTCVLCVSLHRNEIDLGWPVVEAGLRAEPVPSTATLLATAAATAVVEALALLDGEVEPGSVDGTVEWRSGELAPRRRSWTRHPSCRCATVHAL